MTSEQYKMLSKAEKKKVKFKDLPTKNKRGAIISMLIVFVLFPFMCSKMINSSASSPILTQQQKEDSTIRSAFSGYDGSQDNLVKYVKDNMNDPESFKHKETTFGRLGKDSVQVEMTYYGKNGFGGLVKETVIAITKFDGTLLSVNKE